MGMSKLQIHNMRLRCWGESQDLGSSLGTINTQTLFKAMDIDEILRHGQAEEKGIKESNLEPTVNSAPTESWFLCQAPLKALCGFK